MRALALVALVVLALVVVSGCRAHVALDEAPDPTAPLAVRAAALAKLQPTRLVGQRWMQSGLLLEDGTVVVYPSDLAPVVSAESATMRHAAAVEDLDELAGWLHVGALATASATVTGMIAGMALSTDDENAGIGSLVFGASTLVGSLGSLAFLLPESAVRTESERERVLAFHTYERDLRARLALQRSDEELVARWSGAPLVSFRPPGPGQDHQRRRGPHLAPHGVDAVAAPGAGTGHGMQRREASMRTSMLVVLVVPCLALSACDGCAGAAAFDPAGSWDFTWVVEEAAGLCAGEVGQESSGVIEIVAGDEADSYVLNGFGTDDLGVQTGTFADNTLSFEGSFDDDGGTTVSSTTLDLASSGNKLTGTEEWSWGSAAEPDACPSAASSVTAVRRE